MAWHRVLSLRFRANFISSCPKEQNDTWKRKHMLDNLHDCYMERMRSLMVCYSCMLPTFATVCFVGRTPLVSALLPLDLKIIGCEPFVLPSSVQGINCKRRSILKEGEWYTNVHGCWHA